MNIDAAGTLKRNPKIPELAPGDTVRVSSRIVEGDKERIQVFPGMVIRVRQGGSGATVRHVSHGVGVERNFPLHSPLVEKVEIVRHGKVRRANLYYLRSLSGKAARIKERRVSRKKPLEETELTEGQEAPPPAEASAGETAAVPEGKAGASS